MMPQTLNGNPYLGASSTATATDPNFSGNTNNVTNYSGTTSIPQGGIPSYSQVK
ncbi:hypothetical protein ASB7_16070 [Helicobacter ailurogastricus]|nr:hypothetical protein ASB7_16070 [Helicobacter ailurogastricus]GLH58486.1 hypothetical protein NHP214376_12770 [Helicobacter ailurogastricus]GLH59993.1 hypothetical protein NHP214377_12640 [Helicobacter ailurogastricus]